MTTDFTIREFVYDDADYDFVAHTITTIYPQVPTTVAEVKAWDANREPQYPLYRFMIEKDCTPIGQFDIRQDGFQFHPQKWRWLCDVLPGANRRAAYATAFAYTKRFLAAKDVIAYQSSSHETQSEQIDFLHAVGFSMVMRYPESQADLTQFDAADFGPAVQQVLDSGIEIVTAADYAAREPDHWRVWWEVENAIDADIPTPDPTTPPPLDSYRNALSTRPGFALEQWFLALDNGQVVGMTRNRRADGDPTLFITQVTGVLRSHRRRGIARALKVLSMQAVQAAGGTRIITDNEENNPMYALNLQLGFTPQPAWLDFELTVENGAAS